MVRELDSGTGARIYLQLFFNELEVRVAAEPP
jgi:hypothetical protein